MERFNRTLLDMLATAVSDRMEAALASSLPCLQLQDSRHSSSCLADKPACQRISCWEPLCPLRPHLSHISAPVHTKMCENTWGTSWSYSRFDRPKGNNSWLGTWYHGGNFTGHGQVSANNKPPIVLPSLSSTPSAIAFAPCGRADL